MMLPFPKQIRMYVSALKQAAVFLNPHFNLYPHKQQPVTLLPTSQVNIISISFPNEKNKRS